MTRKRLIAGGGALAVVAGLVAASAFGVFTHGGSASASGAARSEGVKVHGQWTLVVRSKSGKVVSRHNFHNDFLVSSSCTVGSTTFFLCGDSALAGIMAGQVVVGNWAITLFGNACSGGFNQCRLYEPSENASGLAGGITRTNNLTVTVPTSGPDAFKIVLHGSVSPPSDGTITEVESTVQACTLAFTPGADCGISIANTRPFSDRTLASAVNVLGGQSVDVTVKISFG